MPARNLPEGVWTVQTEEWWTSVWTSPVANLWEPSIAFLPLVRLAMLNQNALYGDIRCAAEARQLERRWLLDPHSLSQAGYFIPDDVSRGTVATDDASRSAAAEDDGSTGNDASPADLDDEDPRELRLVRGTG